MRNSSNGRSDNKVKDMKNPLVSVIIPTYKRATMLPRAIDSVLNQTYSEIEVVVVDDNNPKTEDRKNAEIIMESYKNNLKVKYIKHEKNKNGSVARNTGIQASTGHYVAFLDDDNYFYTNKIEKQVNYLLNHPEYKAVYCGIQRGEKAIIPTQVGNLTYEQLSGANIIDTNMIMIEKSIVMLFGGWDERLKRNQDVSFMLRYFKTGNQVGVVSEVLAYYDLSDRSNVSRPRENEKNFDQFLNYYDDQIKECENNMKNAESKIYSYRYRGVLLNYLKSKDYIGAIKVYFKMLRKTPFIFNKVLVKGLIRKMQRKPLF